jgi:carboxyl-terminal processing protease
MTPASMLRSLITTPHRGWINHRGITPNVVAPLTKQQKQKLSTHPEELGTARDPQYHRAVNALSSGRTRAGS